MKSLPFRIGVDLGGTKIELAAFDSADIERYRDRLATPQGDYAATVEAIARLVVECEGALGARGTVGVGIPGALSRTTGLVKNANSTCLIGRPLAADLAHALGREVRLANDANCFALSEAVDGAACDAQTVFGVILGTGVGGALVVNRHVLEGANAIAGEWGHNPLPGTDAPPWDCYCGRRGCIETFLSGPGFAALHARTSGETRDAAAIFAAAGAGEPAACASVDAYVERLARALATVINLFDPEAIVLGGGLSAAACLYATVPQRWGRYVFSDTMTTKLLAPAHGAAGGVRGAAWLWGGAPSSMRT